MRYFSWDERLNAYPRSKLYPTIGLADPTQGTQLGARITWYESLRELPGD
jgi:hypothetical protein